MPMAAAAGYDPGGRPWTAFDGGAFELAQTAGWFIRGAAADRLGLYRTLPVVDVVRESGAIDTEYENYATSPPAGDYFGTLDFVREEDRFDVPALYVDSWYDFGVAETFQLFNQQRERALSATARDNQYVIITPSGDPLRLDSSREHQGWRSRCWGVAAGFPGVVSALVPALAGTARMPGSRTFRTSSTI